MYIRRSISVLAAAVSIGICIFITYISRDVEFSTILFNLSFLAIMLAMIAAACLIGLRRLIQDCRALRRAAESLKDGSAQLLPDGTGDAPLFDNAFLDSCYSQYCQMSHSNPDVSCDIAGFINEDVIEEHAHRSLLELIPDILTSLGILGTFVGLVMGLREFDPSGYEQMAGSITPLINGIKVAFITSIYGISLSLAFSFNLRSEFANLSAQIEEFLDTFYLYVKPPYEMDSLSRLLEGQKSREDMAHDLTAVFVEQMGKSFEEAITPAYDRMTEGIRHIVDTFTQNQAQVMTQICETVSRQMKEELREDFSQLHSTVTQLQQAQASCTDFMDHSLSRIQQAFVTMKENMEQTETYYAKTIQQLSDAQSDALRINQEQMQTYQEYVRFLYESIEQFSSVWEANSAQLKEYSDKISDMGPVRSNLLLRESLDRISAQLKEIQKHQLASDLNAELTAANDSQTAMLSKTLRKLDELADIIETPRLFRGMRRK
ncbi:MAG: MotA/TolQ/ExbB proton channel family protein [Lachnospiraceae bacterium]|uniref:MotA/TolQ/ExbB proton channel family protein n=1 Tax=Parablautia sp. Marseille-Q6255 TaxID=3039593 RepID=UPI0024BCC682|nr:MotA/TolQ/ExbB proton channel family protein [Parablautia sp. Marseille-Q6255]